MCLAGAEDAQHVLRVDPFTLTAISPLQWPLTKFSKPSACMGTCCFEREVGEVRSCGERLQCLSSCQKPPLTSEQL